VVSKNTNRPRGKNTTLVPFYPKEGSPKEEGSIPMLECVWGHGKGGGLLLN